MSYSNSHGKYIVRFLAAGLVCAGAWASPTVAEAAETCRSKPAVCARLAAEKRQRADDVDRPADKAAAQKDAAARQRMADRCDSRPAVCARQEALAEQRDLQERMKEARERHARWLATSEGEKFVERCKTKPAVCALRR